MTSDPANPHAEECSSLLSRVDIDITEDHVDAVYECSECDAVVSESYDHVETIVTREGSLEGRA
jgi:hypothetical protein